MGRSQADMNPNRTVLVNLFETHYERVARYIAVRTVVHPSAGAFLLQGFTVPDGVPQLIRHQSGADG